MAVVPPLRRSPRTGQTTEYYPGDDGTFEAGWPGSVRFKDLGNGMIRDQAMGLCWIKEPQLIIPGGPIGSVYQVQVAAGNWDIDYRAYTVGDLVYYSDINGSGWTIDGYYICIKAHTSRITREPFNTIYWVGTRWIGNAVNLTMPVKISWKNAIDDCLALDTCGFSDWRLPNVSELYSLINQEAVGPLTDAMMFPRTQNDYYWSSTTRKGSFMQAYRVNFAEVGWIVSEPKTTVQFIRPVRGGFLNG